MKIRADRYPMPMDLDQMKADIFRTGVAYYKDVDGHWCLAYDRFRLREESALKGLQGHYIVEGDDGETVQVMISKFAPGHTAVDMLVPLSVVDGNR